MGSKYSGEQNYLGNERSSSSSSSSSRKGKKNNSDKPKQPQRGLGVAQLEKIRIHSQLGPNFHPSSVHNPYASTFTQEDIRLQTAHSSLSYSSSSPPTYGYQGHHGVMMGMPDLDRANTTYGDSQPSVARWHPGYENQHSMEPSMTRSFFEPTVQGSHKEMNDLIGSGTEAGNSQEIDLELRLSL
ncbi:hypothetical protein ACS0TY_025602 [Phlomoides rotata]